MASINEIVTRIARRLRRPAVSGSNLQTEIIDELAAAQAKLEEGPTLPTYLFGFGIFISTTAPKASIHIETEFGITGFIRPIENPMTYTLPAGGTVTHLPSSRVHTVMGEVPRSVNR